LLVRSNFFNVVFTDFNGSLVPFGIKLLGVPNESLPIVSLDEEEALERQYPVDDKVLLEVFVLVDKSFDESLDSQSDLDDLCRVLPRDIRGILETLECIIIIW
jgi:hypothetical protein